MEGKDIAEIIISSFAAVGTLAAVIVALWQYKIQAIRKFKIKPIHKIELIGDLSGVQSQCEIYGIDVINIGYRDTYITSWGVYISKKFQLQICNLNSNTRQEIKVEDSLTFKAEKNSLYNNIINKCKINEDSKLKFFITDSTGKMHIKKTKFKIKDLK